MASCWVIFRGSVDDITRYLAVHPGGPKTLFDKAGRDMTEDFNIAHGEQNFRVASMMGPYKIGEIEPFPKASARMKRFMEEWSIPLLHGLLEQRAVFYLDRNDFPELKEPAGFLEWKSQVWSPSGVVGLCKKFWEDYEPRCFDFMVSYLGRSELESKLRATGFSLAGNLNLEMITEEMRDKRNESLKRGRKMGTEEEASGITFLDQGKCYMDNVVKVAIEIERIVEEAVDQSRHAAVSFDEVCTVMIACIFRTVKEGISKVYSCLPGEKTVMPSVSIASGIDHEQ